MGYWQLRCAAVGQLADKSSLKTVIVRPGVLDFLKQGVTWNLLHTVLDLLLIPLHMNRTAKPFILLYIRYWDKNAQPLPERKARFRAPVSIFSTASIVRLHANVLFEQHL